MLSPYDELFVHQTSSTFAEVASTDVAFDDGTYLGVYSADDDAFLFAGMRVSPNTDMIGGYVGLLHGGRQRTVRVSRPWRASMTTSVGPLRLEVVRPFEELRLSLDPNDSGLACDIWWHAAGPPHLEPHHVARRRGRTTTDQSRYSQGGTADGWISVDGHRIEVSADRWSADRDHSWGLYGQRPPLSPSRRWLPPPDPAEGRPRALRLWANFATSRQCGSFHLHEAADGTRHDLNDTFASPFEGSAWETGDEVRFVEATHQLTLVAGTRVLAHAGVEFVDASGGRWRHDYTPAQPPWNPATIGYGPGSWSDGGSMFTYRPEPALEWDEFDASGQPHELTLAGGVTLASTNGAEYLCRLAVTAPDGSTATGLAHLELFLDGPYEPLGLP